MTSSPVLCPAYALEYFGFHEPIQNPVVKEIVPRIVALVVPFFYALQVAAYFCFSIVDFGLSLLSFSPGILCQYGVVHLGYSVCNLASSILEIPEKLVFGSHHQPNYCGDSGRYTRKDLSEHVGLI